MTKSAARIREEALAEINRARVAMGIRPRKTFPKGLAKSRRECPVALMFRPALESGLEVLSHSVKLTDKDIVPGSREERHFVALKKLWSSVPGQHEYQYRILFPTAIRTFILGFDAGKYPDLIRPTASRD